MSGDILFKVMFAAVLLMGFVLSVGGLIWIVPHVMANRRLLKQLDKLIEEREEVSLWDDSRS